MFHVDDVEYFREQFEDDDEGVPEFEICELREVTVKRYRYDPAVDDWVEAPHPGDEAIRELPIALID